MEFLLWLENTGIAQWVTGSNSILAYPTVLFVHTLGLSAVIGLSVFINLRVLGFARGLTLTVLKPFITLVWIAFGLAAVSGTLLLMSTASLVVRGVGSSAAVGGGVRSASATGADAAMLPAASAA